MPGEGGWQAKQDAKIAHLRSAWDENDKAKQWQRHVKQDSGVDAG